MEMTTMSNTKGGKAHYHKIRKELAAMLGYDGDPDALPIDQSMRLDVVFGLKLALDEQRGRQYRSEAPDTAEMLRLSEALEKYLPKQPQPVSADPFEGVDPHKHLEELVTRHFAAKEAERAEKAAERRAQGLSEPFTDPDAAQARIDELEARLAEFESANSPKALPSPSAKVITPRESDIVPPGEIGEFYVGHRPGPDDHRATRQPPVIDGEVIPSKPTSPKRAQQGPITEAEANAQGLRLARHDEPWRPYVGGV
jgi:hypothetical protein